MDKKLIRGQELNLIIILLIAAVSVFAWMMAGSFPSEAGKLPRLISVITILFCGLMVIFMFTKSKSPAEVSGQEGSNNQALDPSSGKPLKEWFLNGGMVLFWASVLFTILLEYIGFTLTSVLFMIGLAVFLGQRKVLYILFYAVSCSLVLYWIFAVLFSIPLPEILF